MVEIFSYLLCGHCVYVFLSISKSKTTEYKSNWNRTLYLYFCGYHLSASVNACVCIYWRIGLIKPIEIKYITRQTNRRHSQANERTNDMCLIHTKKEQRAQCNCKIYGQFQTRNDDNTFFSHSNFICAIFLSFDFINVLSVFLCLSNKIFAKFYIPYAFCYWIKFSS